MEVLVMYLKAYHRFNKKKVNPLFVEFLIIVFHCPQTTALSHTFLSYIVLSYWVTSYVVVRHRRLGLDYWAAISYWLGFLHSLRFGGVYSA